MIISVNLKKLVQCIISSSPSFSLEIMIIIKIESHQFVTEFIRNEAKYFGKQNSKWPTQKTEIFNFPNSQYFSRKFHGLVLWWVG